VGWFLLRKAVNPRISPGPLNVAQGQNNLYVNLNTCNLYYLYRGVSGRQLLLKSSNILRRLLDLDETSVRILSEIVEREEIRLERIDPDYKLYLQQNVNKVAMLESLGFIATMTDGKGFISNVNVPKFAESRYDLGGSVAVSGKVETGDPADEVSYPPRGVIALLSDFYGAEVEFKGVIYLPYYRCRYLSSDGRMRFEIKEDITPKNG
jgi:hypothetical protein